MFIDVLHPIKSWLLLDKHIQVTYKKSTLGMSRRPLSVYGEDGKQKRTEEVCQKMTKEHVGVEVAKLGGLLPSCS